MRELLGYPETLSTEPLTFQGPDPFVASPLVLGRRYACADGFQPLMVFVCEGTCELPWFRRAPRTPETLSETLPDGRRLVVEMRGLFLGGALALGRLPSPAARYQLVVVLEMPLHDVPMSDAAREFQRDPGVLAAVGRTLRGIDALLWPPGR